MSETISDRAERRTRYYYYSERGLIVFTGLLVWIIGAVVLHYLPASGWYAFGAAILLAALMWRQLLKDRKVFYLWCLVEELDSDIKAQIAESHREIETELKKVSSFVNAIEQSLSMELADLRRTLSKELADLRREMTGIVPATSHAVPSYEIKSHTAPRPMSLEELAKQGWEFRLDGLIEVIDKIIGETGATSLRHMGIVIKGARGRFRETGIAVDEKQLSALVRTRLEVIGKPLEIKME